VDRDRKLAAALGEEALDLAEVGAPVEAEARHAVHHGHPGDRRHGATDSLAEVEAVGAGRVSEEAAVRVALRALGRREDHAASARLSQ
jgi:hypothetical protein